MVPHDATASAAAAAGAGMTAVVLVPLTTGHPVVDLAGWALAGGLCAVWWDDREGVTITARWVLGALAKMLVAALTGIVGSVLALTAGAAAPGMAWLGSVPQWALAAVLAAATHKGLPLLAGRFKARFSGPAPASTDGQGGGNAAGGA